MWFYFHIVFQIIEAFALVQKAIEKAWNYLHYLLLWFTGRPNMQINTKSPRMGANLKHLFSHIWKCPVFSRENKSVKLGGLICQVVFFLVLLIGFRGFNKLAPHVEIFFIQSCKDRHFQFIQRIYEKFQKKSLSLQFFDWIASSFLLAMTQSASGRIFKSLNFKY